MKWILWAGVAGLAGIAVVAFAYLSGFSGVIRVVRALLDFFGDTAQALRDWLRKPGNTVRGLCAVLAFGFLAAGMQSWQRGTVIVQQQADYVALQAKAESEKRTLSQQVADREATIAKFVELSKRQKALLETAAKENQAAVLASREAQARAAESEQKYQDAFMKRPPECKAALEVMAAACPTLKGY